MHQDTRYKRVREKRSGWKKERQREISEGQRRDQRRSLKLEKKKSAKGNEMEVWSGMQIGKRKIKATKAPTMT